MLRRGDSGRGECWVVIEGHLDGPTSRTLSDQVEDLLEQGCRRLLVDLRRTLFIDSSGLQALAEALRDIEELGGELVLRTPPGEVYEVGRVKRLGELLATVDHAIEEAEAIRRLDRLVS